MEQWKELIPLMPAFLMWIGVSWVVIREEMHND